MKEPPEREPFPSEPLASHPTPYLLTYLPLHPAVRVASGGGAVGLAVHNIMLYLQWYLIGGVASLDSWCQTTK